MITTLITKVIIIKILLLLIVIIPILILILIPIPIPIVVIVIILIIVSTIVRSVLATFQGEGLTSHPLVFTSEQLQAPRGWAQFSRLSP